MKQCGVLISSTLTLMLASGALLAQASAKDAPAGARESSDSSVPNYFPRPAGDPAAIARGKQLYSANCAFCHGSDAHGGEVGPNLLRSPLVLNDQNGEIIAPVLQNGRISKGMPKFDLSAHQIADLAAFVHSIGTAGEGAFDEQVILVGNPQSGKAYFNGKGGCTACHSVKGDLASIGRKLGPKALQDAIVTGGATGMLGTPIATARPRTARVILPSGAVFEGRLESIDDFAVTVTNSGGERRTFRRDGQIPAVEVHDPYQAHGDLLKAGRDEDIHDLTAYLAGLK